MGIGDGLSLARAVFLDRDGVLNRAVVRDGKPYPPASAAEMEIVAGAPAALARLRDRGFLLLVVTNQPDVARGTQSLETIQEMHRILRRSVAARRVPGLPARRPGWLRLPQARSRPAARGTGAAMESTCAAHS